MQTENSTCTDFHEHVPTQHDSITIHVHTRSHLEAAVEAARPTTLCSCEVPEAGNSGNPDGSGNGHRKP